MRASEWEKEVSGSSRQPSSRSVTSLGMFLKFLADKTIILSLRSVAYALELTAWQRAELGSGNFGHQLIADGIGKSAECPHPHQKRAAAAYNAMLVIGVNVRNCRRAAGIFEHHRKSIDRDSLANRGVSC